MWALRSTNDGWFSEWEVLRALRPTTEQRRSKLPLRVLPLVATGVAPDAPGLRPRQQERYGAEPAANWDTMLQLVVTRPPSTIKDAFEVARSMDLLWQDTVGRPGVTVREHAFDLIGRDRWFLHLRP